MSTMTFPAPMPRAIIDQPISVIQPRPSADRAIPEPLAKILDICWENVEKDVVIPLLRASNPSEVFQENWGLFLRWSHVAAAAAINVAEMQELLDLAGASANSSRQLIEGDSGKLLEPNSAKAFLDGSEIELKVRTSVIDLVQGPELSESTMAAVSDIALLLSAHELCVVSVGQYLATGKKQYRANANVLAQWSYDYADRASGEWGFAQLDLGLASPLTSD